MKSRAYFDHAAATLVDPLVLKAMEPFWAKNFANPGAIHKEGVAARKAVEDARAKMSAAVENAGKEAIRKVLEAKKRD